jgi:O-antigen/teichoic acid export membrane protein
LGFVLMLVSLNTNLPRYAIEHFQGVPELGIFAAVVSFITVGSTIVNAFGQSSTPRMARHFAAKEVRQFLRLVYQMTGVAFGLGVAGMLMSWLLGSFVLRLLYRPEYAEYDGLLVAVMAAGTLSYMAVALGYGVTSARVFDAQMPLFGVAAVCCGVASWLLVPPFGLNGAVLALALGALVQISGQVVILRLAIRKQREAAV